MHIPLRVRYVLGAESGANDCLGYPLIALSVYILKDTNLLRALWQWIYFVLGYQTVIAILIGLLYGFLSRIALQFSMAKNLIDQENSMCFLAALAVTTKMLIKEYYNQ